MTHDEGNQAILDLIGVHTQVASAIGMLQGIGKLLQTTEAFINTVPADVRKGAKPLINILPQLEKELTIQLAIARRLVKANSDLLIDRTK